MFCVLLVFADTNTLMHITQVIPILFCWELKRLKAVLVPTTYERQEEGKWILKYWLTDKMLLQL